MNNELKSIFALVFKVYDLVKDIIEKKGSAENMADIVAVAAALAPVIQNAPSFTKELEELSKPENVADLVAFIPTQFAYVNSDAHAMNILQATLKLLSHLGTDSVELAKAIKG